MNLVPGLAAYAYPLKTLGDAIYLGNDLIMRAEEAAVETDSLRRRRLLTAVIIGGGFSGVEVAGEIAEVAERTHHFYPTLKDEPGHIILLQRGDYLIPEFDAPSLSTFARDKLHKAGVEVRLNSSAQEITARGVRLTSGELIEAATVVSTVGTAPNPLIEKLGLALERGRVLTNPDMSVRGAENVWAVGDCAVIPNAYDQKPSPPTAQFAIRQAKQLAANLSRTFSGQPTKPFSFKVLGMLASLGNRNAVAEILGIRISGFIAWVLWRGIYLSKLPSFARKLEVVVDWTWKALFPPNIVQLPLSRTGSVGLAHYAPGEFIFRKGDPAESLFVIQAGTAGVYMDEPSSPIAVLKPGEHFGQEALGPKGQGPHRVSVKAETQLDLITLRRDDFERLAQSDATLQKSLQSDSAALKGYEGLMALAKDNPTLASIKIAEVMTSPVETLLTTGTLAEAIGHFDGGKPSYPVVDESGRLQGYCGRAELFAALRELPSLETPIGDFMRKDPPVISADQSIIDAAVIMLREEIEMLAVVSSDGGVIGVVSPLDVIRTANASLSRDSNLSIAQGNVRKQTH
jgi:NADH dehydrogenase